MDARIWFYLVGCLVDQLNEKMVLSDVYEMMSEVELTLISIVNRRWFNLNLFCCLTHHIDESSDFFWILN